MDKIESKVIERAKWLYDTDDDEEARKEVINDWGMSGLRGYGFFSGGDEPIALHVCRIDELAIYDSDSEASKQAEKDGVKLIPYAEQPKTEFFRHYRYIDTEENRRTLKEEVQRRTGA